MIDYKKVAVLSATALRVRSSVGEHYLHTVGVVGSNPIGLNEYFFITCFFILYRLNPWVDCRIVVQTFQTQQQRPLLGKSGFSHRSLFTSLRFWFGHIVFMLTIKKTYSATPTRSRNTCRIYLSIGFNDFVRTYCR